MHDERKSKKDLPIKQTEALSDSSNLPNVSLAEKADLLLENCSDRLEKIFNATGESGSNLIQFESEDPVKENEVARLRIDGIVEYGADPGYPIDFHYETCGTISIVTDEHRNLSLRIDNHPGNEIDEDVVKALKEFLDAEAEKIGISIDSEEK